MLFYHLFQHILCRYLSYRYAGVLHEIDKTRRNFLWKKNADDRKGMPLANWEMVCKPKKFGGLGIIDIHAFNDALLEKW